MEPALPAMRTLTRVGIVVAILGSLFVVRQTDPRRTWGQTLRSRLVLGVPWGTLVSIAGVLCVYLFVQDGLANWRRPITISFTAWSYFYPLGWLAAPFSHANAGHLVGNLVGTIAFAPLAEYFFSHFPRRRGASAFSSWRTNPYVRAFVVFPLGVFVVGVLSSVLAWGPVIGFSGVVFAFAGFALVRYPIVVIVALSARGVIDLIRRALLEPELSVTAGPSYSTPWWASIAIQGHTLGLLLGALLGAAFVYRRGRRPSALRLWVGSLLFAVSLSLWAIYWFRGNETYVLFRGLGVIFVFLLATGLTVAVRALEPVDRNDLMSLAQVAMAFLVLFVPIVAMAPLAIATNLMTVDDASTPGDGPGVTVQDYTVTYAEDTPNQLVSVVDVSFFGESTKVNTSGVIVISEERQIWARDVSKGQLAHDGRARVQLGGLGWRETVSINREGWVVAGGDAAYSVWLRPGDGEWVHAFDSDRVTADPVLAGRNVFLTPENGEFLLELSRENETLARAPLPPENGSVTLDGIRFVREDDRLFATYNDTRIEVAKKED